MHRSHVPILEWFWAAYLVATLTPGISALQLQRQLGLGSYRTVWFVLNRLRKGMVNDTRTPLSGIVEADETIIGGPVKTKRGRGVTHGTHKSLVVGAVEVISYFDKNGKLKEKARRLRLAVIRHADEETIGTFLKKNVKSGSTIRSDGWRGVLQNSTLWIRARSAYRGFTGARSSGCTAYPSGVLQSQNLAPGDPSWSRPQVPPWLPG